MSSWRVEEGPGGLRLHAVVRRALGSEQMTWADVFQPRLRSARVLVLYFPSRFDLETDRHAQEALRSFGRLTSADTSVNFWDPTDENFEDALVLFDLKTPPALVLATGLADDGVPADSSNLYSIAISDPATLSNPELLARAVNTAHRVLMRGDRAEIAGYLRARAATGVLSAVGAVAAELRDAFLKLKPKLGLPGGVSIQFG